MDVRPHGEHVQVQHLKLDAAVTTARAEWTNPDATMLAVATFRAPSFLNKEGVKSERWLMQVVAVKCQETWT